MALHAARAITHRSLLSLGCCGYLCASMAYADVASHTFTVSATIENGCILGASGNVDVSTFGTLNFGSNLNNLANPIHTTSTANNGSIIVRCTPNTLVRIALNSGSHAVGNIGSGRLLKHNDGNATLRYQLYQNPSRTSIWGNDDNGGSAFILTADGQTQTVTIHASLLPTPTLPAPGQYADVVTVTVSY